MDMALSIFLIFPLGALVIGLLFAAGAWRRRRVLPGIAAVLWIAYGIYESLMYARVLCSGECNIRVDLVVIYPVLLLATVAALASLWRARRPAA